jgi:opacity protein-like surface antigen
MKKGLGFFSCVAVATLMVFLSAGSVFATENSNTGFYVGVTGGYVVPQTMQISDKNESLYADTELKNGYLAGFKAGWNTPFTKNILAMEMEYNYIFGTDYDKGKMINLMGQGLATFDGTIKIHAFLTNFKARYPNGRIHPYGGFGVGWSYFQLGDTIGRSNGKSAVLTGDSGTAFCWQLLAGVDFDITPNMSLGIGYKYFTTKPSFGGNTNADFDYKASIVTLGLAYTF